MKRISYIIIFIFVSISCKSQSFISFEGDTTVVTEYNNGRQWAYRDIGDFVVGISNCEAKDDYGKYYQINIFINNHGEIPFTFYPQDVTADLLKQNGDTLQLTVYTNEKFQKKIKRAQTWAMALYGFSAGLNAGTAGYSTSYSTSYSPRGYAYTTVTHHYDANAAYQAQMAASYQMMTLESAMKNDRMLKEQGYLKTTTIHPGESIVGYMNIKRKKGDIVTVKIPVDNYVYYFDWDVSRNK